jgi:hypothetical protein
MRRFGSSAAKRAYDRSNLILQLNYAPSLEARDLTDRLLNIDPPMRGPASQALVDLLARELKVPLVRVKFLDLPQKHSLKDGKLTYKEYAHYDPEGSITIYNKTAVRKQYLASKAYLDTLIHEFLHHLDYELLRLSHTYHTKGFYSRLGDILGKLRNMPSHPQNVLSEQ